MSARAAIAVVALLVSSRVAGAAEVCPRGDGDPASGPLIGGAGPADFGAVPEACGGTDGLSRLRGALLVASTMPDYYGSIFAGTTIRARYQLGERTTLSAAADVFDYRYVNNGGLSSQGASGGPGTVAVQQTFPAGAGAALAAYARALVPLDSARQSGIETGLELGGAFRLRAGARWIVDGGLALAAPLDVIGGQAHLRLEPGALAEAWLRLGTAVALCAGLDVRAEVAPELQLGTLAPRLGARFAVRRRWWTAALVEVPWAGADRTDVVAGVYLGFSP